MSTLEQKVISGELNPVIYMPMKDAATAHVNLGYGGSFSQNGVLATADVGANELQCRASEFDGVDDYLSSTSLVVEGNSKQVTLSFISEVDSNTSSYGNIFVTNSYGFRVRELNNKMSIYMENASGDIIFQVDTDMGTYSFNALYTFTLSVDLTNILKTRFFKDGEDITAVSTVSTFTDDFINFEDISNYTALMLDSFRTKGKLGELYLDTNYIDLSTNNPFWDSETNKPIPVRTAMETLGSNPLIAMPIDASNPTINYGSGGDFTLNGGGLIGARGANEQIARSAKFGVSGDELVGVGTQGMIDSRYISVVFTINPTTVTTTDTLLSFKSVSGQQIFTLTKKTNDKLGIVAVDTRNANATIIRGQADGLPFASAGIWSVFMLVLDSLDSSNNKCVINGVTYNVTSGTFNQVATFDLENITDMFIGSSGIGTSADSLLTTLFICDDYIDFSQEENRNIFVNQLGYPRPDGIKKAIADGTIPNPEILMLFEDGENLGHNDGTGGDFTVNGTVTQGSDFTLN